MFIQLGQRPEELFAFQRTDVVDDSIRIDEALTKGQIKETKTVESAGNIYVPQIWCWNSGRGWKRQAAMLTTGCFWPRAAEAQLSSPQSIRIKE